MKNEAKQIMKIKQAPYEAYSFCIGVPITILIVYILTFLGISVSGLGTMPLVFTILAHIKLSKLKLLSRKKYIAPILMYANEIITIVTILPAITHNTDINPLFSVTYIIQLAAIILFIINSKKIKKLYPTMQIDHTNAIKEYKLLKKTK